jgi:hypothetical protein
MEMNMLAAMGLEEGGGVTMDRPQGRKLSDSGEYSLDVKFLHLII